MSTLQGVFTLLKSYSENAYGSAFTFLGSLGSTTTNRIAYISSCTLNIEPSKLRICAFPPCQFLNVNKTLKVFLNYFFVFLLNSKWPSSPIMYRPLDNILVN
jgi:hypothetical protein